MEQNKQTLEIPKGWTHARIDEICDLINGRAFKPTEWAGQGIPIIRIQNLNNPNAEYNYCNFDIENKYLVNDGQLLFAWSGTPGTSFGAHIWQNGLGVLNQHIFKVNINEDELDKKYLMYLLNRNISEYVGKAHGTAGLAHITKGKFDESLVLLPPLPEQHRIVAKIEELFTRLDAGVEALKKIQLQLKRYRQSVLKSAFEGRLTAEWREAHKGELEPASALLEKIKAGRKKSGKHKELPPLDTTDLPGLPDGWAWTRVGDCVNIVEKVNPQSNPEIEFIYLDIASIDNTHQLITNPKKYTGKEAPSRARQLVKQEDILFSTVRTYLKNIAVVKSEYDGQIASTGFCVIRPLSILLTEFAFHWIQTDFFLNPLNELQRGTSYPAVRDGDVFAQPIPISSTNEQKIIIEEIERCFSVADKIERTIEVSLKQAERLRQSILKRAFEGRLVPQDPSDEPAGKLLERIRTEKAETQTNTNRRRAAIGK